MKMVINHQLPATRYHAALPAFLSSVKLGGTYFNIIAPSSPSIVDDKDSFVAYLQIFPDTAPLISSFHIKDAHHQIDPLPRELCALWFLS